MDRLVGCFLGTMGFCLTVMILGDRLDPVLHPPDVSRAAMMAENAELRHANEVMRQRVAECELNGLAVSVWQRVETDAARRAATVVAAGVIPTAAEMGPGDLIPATSLPTR